eukprot:scaffold20935_cov69-Phaeocystis_antarctica.AAC.3
MRSPMMRRSQRVAPKSMTENVTVAGTPPARTATTAHRRAPGGGRCTGEVSRPIVGVSARFRWRSRWECAFKWRSLSSCAG